MDPTKFAMPMKRHNIMTRIPDVVRSSLNIRCKPNVMIDPVIPIKSMITEIINSSRLNETVVVYEHWS